MVTPRLVVLALACVGLQGLQTSASDTTNVRFVSTWPQFRGPGGQSLAADNQSLPSELSPGKNLIWKTDLPAGASSPCIWKDRVFITGCDKEKQDLETICINRADGHIRWLRVAPAAKVVN